MVKGKKVGEVAEVAEVEKVKEVKDKVLTEWKEHQQIAWVK